MYHSENTLITRVSPLLHKHRHKYQVCHKWRKQQRKLNAIFNSLRAVHRQQITVREPSPSTKSTERR